MDATKPIIASRSGYPQMIDEAGCGTFVSPGDAAALGDEILRYASMDSQHRRLLAERRHLWPLANRDYWVLGRDSLEVHFPPVR